MNVTLRISVLGVALLAMCAASAHAQRVAIQADADAVGMGGSVTVTATATRDDGSPLAECMLLPYVNERRWGSHESTDAQGRVTFLLPLPNPGPARIQVLARVSKLGAFSYWIWAGGAPSDGQTVYMQKTFTLDSDARAATLRAAVDDQCEFYLDGERVGDMAGWTVTGVFGGLESRLRAGTHILALKAFNGSGPAGILARLDVTTDAGAFTCQTDASWRGWTEPPAGWPGAAHDAGMPATVIERLDRSLWAPTMKDWPEGHGSGDLMAGRLMPDDGAKSNAVTIEVTRRTFPASEPSGTLVCMQWEPWFTPHNAYWQTAQAVPVMGFYSSYNRDAIRQHVLWFVDLGVDFIMPDWSNHIWDKQHWNERPDGTNEIIHATELLLETLADMRDEGIPVPKVVLMPGLSNGPPTTMNAMNEQLDWVYHAWIRNPRFEGLWQDYDGKPLVVILDTGLVAKRETVPVDDSHYTVRWMSTQLQILHHEKEGYWSWMDGSLLPVVTYCDGKAEAVTVTPAYFADGGWLGADARGRRGGTTYIESFKAALDTRPRVIQLHQWNEFTGQAEGQGYGPNHDRYVDTYSVELSDDLEPVSLTAPGYRGDEGGWGFYYLNLTRALLDLYRGKAPHDTIMAVGAPIANAVVTCTTLDVAWSLAGAPPAGFAIAIDGKILADKVQGTACSVALEGFAPGAHELSVTAEGATTRYPLSLTREDVPLDTPAPVIVRVPFAIGNAK